MGVFYKIKEFLFVELRILKYRILSDCKKIKGKPTLYHPLLLKGKGTVQFGDQVQIGVKASPYFYSHYAYIEARFESSQIIIGNNVAINNALSLVSYSKIVIGNNVLIGTHCNMMDNDAHQLHSEKRNELPESSEIHIEDNVFIGSNVTILKGVRIGKNSVIGNGSIVTKSIPPNTVAAGNPIRIIKSIP